MADIDYCEACEDLRNTAPSVVANGISDTECNNLRANKGLSGRSDNCTDLNMLNDCLMGSSVEEAKMADVCDWRAFMISFATNAWTILKAIICAICGLQAQISGAEEMATAEAFVRYYRDISTDYRWYGVEEGDVFGFDIYMDSAGQDPGSREADRDYVVQISNCTNYNLFNQLGCTIAFYSSGDQRPIAEIRQKHGQHPTFSCSDPNEVIGTMSWTTSGSVLVRRGEHVKVTLKCTNAVYNGSTANCPRVQLHNFILTWIPANIGTTE